MHIGKERNNFSGNGNRSAREQADGKVVIVAGNEWKEFAETNSCRETPDTDNLT
jgi:hypothetical protein